MTHASHSHIGTSCPASVHHNAREGVQDDAGEQHSAGTDLPAKLKPQPKDQSTNRCILSVLIFISFECFIIIFPDIRLQSRQSY